jgi:MarR family transcriptional regulator, organic hydroperoxide resistance regulator
MPSSVHATTGALLWRLTMKWRAAVERTVTPLGLTHAQYTLLGSLYAHTLRHEQPPSQRELADYTGLDPVYVSKLIRALERAGFVDRATHPADPRAVQVRITEQGVDVIQRAVTIVHELLEELTAPIGGMASQRNREFTETLRILLAGPGDNREEAT